MPRSQPPGGARAAALEATRAVPLPGAQRAAPYIAPAASAPSPSTRAYPTGMLESLQRALRPPPRRTAVLAALQRPHWLALAVVLSASADAGAAAVVDAPRPAAFRAPAAAPPEEAIERGYGRGGADQPAAPQPIAGGGGEAPNEVSAHDSAGPRPRLQTGTPARARAQPQAPRSSRIGVASTPRSAAQALARGRHREALERYRELAQRSPGQRAFAHMAATLERKVAALCAQRAASGDTACLHNPS